MGRPLSWRVAALVLGLPWCLASPGGAWSHGGPGVMAAASTALECAGDCDGDGGVSVAELIAGVRIALGLEGVSTCPPADRNADGEVGIDELVAAVRSALEGCSSAAPPTATPSPTATASPTMTPTPIRGAVPEAWAYEATVYDSRLDPAGANLSRPEFCVLGDRAYVTFRQTVPGSRPGVPDTRIVLKVFAVDSGGDWTDVTRELFADDPHALYGPGDPNEVGAFTDHQLLCRRTGFVVVFEVNFTEEGRKMGQMVVRRYDPDWTFRDQVTLFRSSKEPAEQLYKSDDPGAAWLNGTLWLWVVRLQDGLGSRATGFALYGLDPGTLEVTVDDGGGGPRLLANPLEAPFAGVLDFVDDEYRLLISPRAAAGTPYDQDGLVEYRFDQHWNPIGHSVAEHPFGDDRPMYTTSRVRYGEGMEAWGFTVVPAGVDASGGAIGSAWIRLAGPPGATYFRVSDGDNTRHTEIAVDGDKAYVAYFHVTEPRTTEIRRYRLPEEQVVPQLHVFYVNHTHLAGDHWPYTGPDLTAIDSEVARNFLDGIEGIARVLERHGWPASWEVVYGAAQGFCRMEGEDNVFARLLRRGHEVGLHVHRYADYDRVRTALRTDCGVEPSVTSGLRTDAQGAGLDGFQQVMSSEIARQVSWGIAVGTSAMSSGRLFEWCGGRIGSGNDVADTTGNLLFPWRPDYPEENICADNQSGDFVFVDHVQMEAWAGEGGELADVLRDAQFERLRRLFDATVKYMADHRPRRFAAWGFVTHVHEFAVGEKGEDGPSAESLAAFDRFLAHVAGEAAAGRVILATAGEIGKAAFAVQPPAP